MPVSGAYAVVSSGRPLSVASRKPAATTSTTVDPPGRAPNRTVLRDRNVRSPGLPPPSVKSISTS